MAKQTKYGTLLKSDIKIHRQYFRELVKMLGVYVLYRSPKEGRKYTTWGEIDVDYNPPIKIGCIFDEHPTQQTLKKMGWVSELQDNSSIIHVDYDLENLQQGSIFIIPSGLDDGKAKIFRVIKISNSIVYPASITCEIVPEHVNTFKEIENNVTEEEIYLKDEKIGPVALANVELTPDEDWIMNLVINNVNDYNFILQIERRLKKGIKLNLMKENFIKIDIALNETFKLKETILSKDVILYALDNIQIIKLEDNYIIEFNPTIYYPNTDIKMITLIQFISYGVSNVHGNKILINEFKKLNNILDILYKRYKDRGIIV